MLWWVKILSFTFVVILLFGSSESAWNRSIIVSPNGTDNATCVRQNATCSLHYALNFGARNSTEILILPGPYHLKNATTFEYFKDLALVRSGSRSSVNISCEKGAGLAFKFCENIVLQGITLHGCGSLHNSTVGTAFGWRAHIQFYSAVFVVYTKNFAMNDSHIVQSLGIGLNMYDVGGVVAIKRSSFEDNGPHLNCSELESDIAMAGGGVYMELTSTGGLPPFQPWPGKANYDSDSSYQFLECTFRNNTAPESCLSSYIEIPGGEDHFPFSRGGGLSIFVRGHAQNNKYRVNNCSFVDNSALWGAGFFLEFQDQTQSNVLTVALSNFSDNRAMYAGGASRTGLLVDSEKGLLENKISFEDCIFTKNKAALGGGVSHCQSHYVPGNESDIRYVEFKGCTWTRNKATMGSAIGLAAGSVFSGLEQPNPRIPYLFSMFNCQIHKNMIIQTEDRVVIGQGALYTYSLPVVFKGKTTFKANNHTAVVLDNTVLRVHGFVEFLKNIGFQGGALSIYGQSKLILMPNSELHFIRNVADEKGGAIYVQRSGPPVVAFDSTELITHGCFLWYNNNSSLSDTANWQTKVVFQDNHASFGGGKSIYVATLQGCRKTGEPRMNNSALEWHFMVYNNTEAKTNVKDEISTDPIRIQLNENDWEVAPSEVFSATIKLIDEKNSSVQGVVKLNIPGSDVQLDAPSPLLLVRDIKHNGKVDGLRLYGQNKRKFNVSMRTVGGQDISTSISKNLMLKNCNPGFFQKGQRCECLPVKKTDGVEACGPDGKSLWLRAGFWGGYVNEQFAIYPCPPHYCNKARMVSALVYNKTHMCRGNRDTSSVLCGECKKNFSVNLGDEDCSLKCNNDHLWYLLLFCVVMLVVVLVILRINLDIFTTYLNSWLYSYQIILVLLDEGQQLDDFITSIIRLANWQIPGVGSCLYHGMNNLHKHGINYILPAYILALLIVLGKIARRWPSCYINRNVYRAFCTLLVLCYTNVTSISFEIIHWVHLGGKWVLFIDGNIEYSRDWKEHLPFTILATIWIVFFVIPIPLMLLFTPWFLKKFPCLQNFRLYFDNFQQCFKVKYRWFAAFYFICRFYILLVALYIPIGPLRWTILEVSCVLIVVICVYIQPYNEDYAWLNTLDAVLLTNICFVTIFSSGKNSEASDAVQTGLGKTVHILAYVPLAYFVVLLGYSGWKFFCPSDPSAYILEDKSDQDDLETSSTRPLDTHYA